MIFLGKSTDEVKALSNYPWSIPSACKIYAMKDVDEESGANGKYPLFVIDLNPGTERIWTGIELKATTNNFVGSDTVSVPFYTATTANGMYLGGTETYDWCRLYILSQRAHYDIRKWIRITNTFDLNGYAPTSLAIIVDPTLFKRGQGDTWMKENNEELIWSYTKVGLDSSETDQDGENVWRPIMPVKWYKQIPEWANQTAIDLPPRSATRVWYSTDEYEDLNISGEIENGQISDRAKKIEIGSSITGIGYQAFHDYGRFKIVTIPDSVTTIGDEAFYGCTGLTNVTIPSGVSRIERDAFYYCTSVKNVYCYPNPSNLTWIEDGCDDFKLDGSTICHVKAEYLTDYQNKFNG